MLKSISFYSSLVGKELRNGRKATHAHVLLYGAVEAHSFGKLGCIASNKTLADETGYAVKKISERLLDMREAGWISYDLKENRRGSIEPLLVIDIPLPKKGKPLTQKGESPLPKKGAIDNSNIDKSIDIHCEPTASREIVAILEKFNKLTPSLGYNKPPQRKACEEMISRFGFEQTLSMVDKVLSVQGEKYAPRATTPYAMWKKIGDFGAYLKNKSNTTILSV
jgi:hypothetical protein